MFYRIQEASFDLPDGSVDQSINVLTVVSEESDPFSLTITRKDTESGTSLAEYVVSEILIQEERDGGFELLWKREYVLDGRPALILAIRVGQGDSPVEQRRIYVMNGRHVLTVTASVSGVFTPAQLDVLNGFAGSFRFVT